MSDLINQNRQLTEEINQLKKQSELQYQLLLEQLKKNAELRLEMDQRHSLLKINVESLRAIVKYLPGEYAIVLHRKEKFLEENGGMDARFSLLLI